MYRLVPRPRSPLAFGFAVTAACTMAAAIPSASRRPVSQPPLTRGLADNPDVLGAERLFSAWIEGQIAYRGLPGNRRRRRERPGARLGGGLRLRRCQREDADDADHEVPHGVAQQAVHRHRDHAAARAGQAAPRRSGVELPAVVQGEAGGRRRRPDHHRATPLAQLGTAARSRRPLDVVRVPDRRRAPPPVRRSAGGVRAVGAVEVLQPRVRRRRHGHRKGERRAVGRLRRPQHLQAARHDSRRAWTRTFRGSPCRTGAACRTGRARCSRSSTRAEWRRPPASRRTSRTWRSSSRPSSAAARAAGIADREHRVAARNAPRALGRRELDVRDRPRLRHESHRQPDVRWTRRRLSRQHDADAHSARRQGRRHRAHQHERLQPVRHRAAVDDDRRKGRRQGVGAEAGRGGVGSRRGRASRGSIAGAAEIRR